MLSVLPVAALAQHESSWWNHHVGTTDTLDFSPPRYSDVIASRCLALRNYANVLPQQSITEGSTEVAVYVKSTAPRYFEEDVAKKKQHGER